MFLYKIQISIRTVYSRVFNTKFGPSLKIIEKRNVHMAKDHNKNLLWELVYEELVFFQIKNMEIFQIFFIQTKNKNKY